ncbi:hypothetical protein BaRGS_00038619 [Batillaria attramentaria]|uniref:ZAD domain-containing protein n=1 Tax=Batillaria attramentaria TaxID=370345 RepID=A0ABD0J5B1_9CAEN
MESTNEHTESTHTDKLNALCRLCGDRVTGKKVKDSNVKLCTSFSAHILHFYGLNLAEDIENKHSKSLCLKCYARLTALKKSPKPPETVLQNAEILIEKSSAIWAAYDPDVSPKQCATCSHYDGQKKGGRPAKHAKLTKTTKETFPFVCGV